MCVCACVCVCVIFDELALKKNEMETYLKNEAPRVFGPWLKPI